MRHYTAEASRPGGFTGEPGKYLASEARVRQVCVAWFRRWFGRAPTFCWHKDGFMAEAWDERGNKMMVTQWNNND